MEDYPTQVKRKRPACPVCGKKKWHKTSTGRLECPLGHEYQGYIEEELEYTGVSTVTRKKAKKDRGTKNVEKYFSKRGDYLFAKCLQILLQNQVYVLIQNFGAPEELEDIVKELWLLRLSDIKIQRHKDDDIDLHGNMFYDISSEDEDESNANKKKDTLLKPDSLDKDSYVMSTDFIDDSEINENEDYDYLGHENKKLDEQIRNLQELAKEAPYGTENEINALLCEDQDYSFDGILSESIKLEHQSLAEKSGGSLHPHPGSTKKPREKRTKYQFLRIPRRVYSSGIFTDTGKMGVSWTAAICFLGLVWIRYPILISDFYRLINEERIPYLSVLKVIPKSWRIRLSPSHLSMLNKIGVPSMEKFRHTVLLFSQMYNKKHGIKMPLSNPKLIIFSMVKRTNLPVQVYALAEQVFRLVSPLEKIVCSSFFNTTQESSLANIERLAAASFVIVLKMIYGLDGIKRSQQDIQHFVDDFGLKNLKMPTENEFIDYIRFDFLSQFPISDYSELSTFDDDALKKYLNQTKSWLLLDGDSKRVKQRARFEKQLTSILDELKGFNDWNDSFHRFYQDSLTKEKKNSLANRFSLDKMNTQQNSDNENNSVSNIFHFLNPMYCVAAKDDPDSKNDSSHIHNQLYAEDSLSQIVILDSQDNTGKLASNLFTSPNKRLLQQDQNQNQNSEPLLKYSNNTDLSFKQSFIVPGTFDQSPLEDSKQKPELSNKDENVLKASDSFDASIKNGLIPSAFHQQLGLDLLTKSQKHFSLSLDNQETEQLDIARNENLLLSGDMIPSYLTNYQNDLSLGNFHPQYTNLIAYLSHLLLIPLNGLHECVTKCEKKLLKTQVEMRFRHYGPYNPPVDPKELNISNLMDVFDQKLAGQNYVKFVLRRSVLRNGFDGTETKYHSDDSESSGDEYMANKGSDQSAETNVANNLEFVELARLDGGLKELEIKYPNTVSPYIAELESYDAEK